MICPVCKARNDQGPQCRRCKADLSLLFALDDRRQLLLTEARRHFAAGRWDEALAGARAADALRHGTDARQLEAVCHLLRGDHGRALACHAAASRAEP